MNTQELLIQLLPKAISAYQNETGRKVVKMYLAEPEVWPGNFSLFIETDYPRPHLPYDDFEVAYNTFKRELGEELFYKIDTFIVKGKDLPFIYRNNAIVNPSTGASYATYWVR